MEPARQLRMLRHRGLFPTESHPDATRLPGRAPHAKAIRAGLGSGGIQGRQWGVTHDRNLPSDRMKFLHFSKSSTLTLLLVSRIGCHTFSSAHAATLTIPAAAPLSITWKLQNSVPNRLLRTMTRQIAV